MLDLWNTDKSACTCRKFIFGNIVNIHEWTQIIKWTGGSSSLKLSKNRTKAPWFLRQTHMAQMASGCITFPLNFLSVVISVLVHNVEMWTVFSFNMSRPVDAVRRVDASWARRMRRGNVNRKVVQYLHSASTMYWFSCLYSAPLWLETSMSVRQLTMTTQVVCLSAQRHCHDSLLLYAVLQIT